MERESGDQNGTSKALLGLLIAPLAVLLALAANWIGGFGLSLDTDGMFPLLAVAGAAMIGIAPRILREKQILTLSSQRVSLIALAVTAILAKAVQMTGDSNILAALVFITMFGVQALDAKSRHEWATILTFTSVGFVLAMAAGAYYGANQVSDYTVYSNDAPSIYNRINALREGMAFVFFTMWTIMIILGLLVAVLARGVLNPESKDGWFGHISPLKGKWNKTTLPLQIALLVWASAHAATLWFMNSVTDADRLGMVYEDGYHGYIGFWPALLTGIIALIVSYMVAERWFTRAMMTTAMWILYQVSAWYDAGLWENDNFEGAWAVWIWFGITFALGVVIYWFSTHEKYGGWMNREIHDPSGARKFWSAHWAGIMIFSAFIIGLAIRIQWYAVPSMNAYGTATWDMTGGSDPWYMKRVVDYILAQNAHLIVDADRSYPLGGINPRPPLFTWSLAIGAMILTSLLQIPVGDAAWWSMLALPAIFGAFIIFPIASMAKDHFGKGAGVIAAWLIAFMPSHVTHSTWGLADHDSFVLLFLSAGFMYYLRAVKHGGDERLSKRISAKPISLFNAVVTVFEKRPRAVANAIAAGVCIGLVALGWKGFVYGPAIIFLTYSIQVALNMFKRRDSTIITTLNLVMLGVIFLMTIPFYAHPQMDLVWNSTGLQPLIFIAIFTLAIGFITTGFRDKPWLLVLGTLFVGGTIFLSLLAMLQYFELSNSWNVLTTGSGYFTKNKIFGTIAEASAPNRGMLFASFGPIVFILSLSMGIIAIWEGLKQKQQVRLVLGMWVLIASYMAWSAGRFVFNASPAMAVLGAWGVVSLWSYSGAGSLLKEWRRLGIRTPGDRISGARKALWRTPQFSAIGMIMVILVSQHATYGLDSAIPGSSEHESGIDEDIYNVIPGLLRWNQLGFSLLDDSDYENSGGRWYLGSFGSGFNDEGWNRAYDWLSQQDANVSYSDKPAFVSWWDYGFQALDNGEHPSVSDNFQSGIPSTGNMLLARNQDDLVAMFIWQLGKGDVSYNYHNGGGLSFTSYFENSMVNHLGQETFDIIESIQTSEDSATTSVHAFKVIQTNDNLVIAEGQNLVDGLVSTSGENVFRIYEDGIIVPCDSDTATTCDGDSWTSFDSANSSFNYKVRTSRDTTYENTHYIFGDYWYTNDLVDEFNSVSTHIHRDNARLATVTQILTNSLDSEGLNDLYADLMDNRVYTVQDHEGAPGETITRNHEIRYFAVDHRLYPKAGRYNADENFNGGNPTGIFTAPTILSGQDFTTFMSEVYETVRGEFPDEMTRAEFDDAMQKDYINQQSGSDIDPLQLSDVRIDHKAEFFKTMVARTYVGYGASTLGVDTVGMNPQPGLHIGTSGSPNTFLTNALPMPGAMMNHFVIANWYDNSSDNTLGSQVLRATSQVKILKYYSGAEISGTVEMAEGGQNLDGVRLLFERDAFSGEDETDRDSDNYWIPIGSTDADADGSYSFLAPAGKIRVSAYVGEFDPTADRLSITSGQFASGLSDVLVEDNDDRQTNAITAVLGQVSNMTWLGESVINVTGPQADRLEQITDPVDVLVSGTGIKGLLVWSGHEDFEGETLDGAEIILDNIWNTMANISLTSTSGAFSTDEVRIMAGSGEVIFDEPGTFTTSDGLGYVTNFTGNYTRLISEGRSYSANGTWTGAGTLVASWLNASGIITCENLDDIPVVPENETICSTSETDTYYLAGEVIANGRMTAEGVVTLRKELVGENFEGSGTFDGIGTINGTGQFIGSGYFSGDIVNPGSFYLSDLVPGEYQVTIVLPNSRKHVMDQSLTVPVSVLEADLSIPGFLFSDVLLMDDGTPVANQTMEIIDLTFGDTEFTSINTDENGNFSNGPMLPGEYYWRVDIDSDGLYDANETFAIYEGDDANVTLIEGMQIQYMTDVTVQLRAVDYSDGVTELLDVANRVVTFTNIDLGAGESVAQTFNVTANASGVLQVELTQGTWIASDDGDDLHVLWQEIEVRSDNQTGMTWNYTESAWVNGTVYLPAADTDLANLTSVNFDSNKFETASTSLFIHFRSGNIDLETVTNITGAFSMRLPVDRAFHVTAIDSFSKASTGVLLTDASDGIYHNDIPNVLFLTPTAQVSGKVSLRNESISWDSAIPGWEPVEIIAVNEDGLEWREAITINGDFLFDLQPGSWDFSLSTVEMNTSSYSDLVINQSGNNELNFIAEPANISVTLRVYLDHADERSWENGTAVQPDISLVPTTAHGIGVNFTAADYNLDGELIVNISIGSYTVEIDYFDANDENATDYSSLPLDVMPGLDVSLNGDVEAFEVALEPRWLVNGIVVEDDNSTPLTNQPIWYLDLNDGSIYGNILPDENGSFSGYVPQGDFVFMIHSFISNSTNISEIYRTSIVIDEDSSTRTGLHFRTMPVMQVNLTLKQNITDVLITDFWGLEAVSLDGLGNVSANFTDATTGSVVIDVLPGNWTLYLNHMSDGSDPTIREKLLLEEGVINFSTADAVNGVVELGDVMVDLTVEINGKVYWKTDTNEGIPAVNVTIVGGIINETVETDSNGFWSKYVPIYQTYNVSASKFGFDSVYYNTDNVSGIIVENVTLNQDIEMVAGLVSVSGNVTDLIDATRLDGASITLYPEVGVERDSIEITGALNAGVLSWSADVTPGNWVVVVLEANPGPNGGGVAIGLLDASISAGGSLELEMSQGGRVEVSTSWTDFELQERNASDSMIEEPVLILVDIGDEQSWNLDLDDKGELDLILPIGSVTLSAEFSTVEHDLALTMNYTGAKSGQVLDDPLDLTLQFNRRVVSDLNLNITAVKDLTAVIVDGNMTILQAIEDGSGYSVIEVDITVDYDGNQISDTFSASGSVSGQDGSKWAIQFQNGSADEWIDDLDIVLGVGMNSTDTNQVLQMVIKAKIILPAQNETFVFELGAGHDVVFEFTTGSAMSNLLVNVSVPQNYSIALDDIPSSIGVADNGLPGKTFSVTVVNNGNGPESIDIGAILPQNCVDDLWKIEPSPTTIDVEPRATGSQKFTVYSPTSGAQVESCLITVQAQSEEFGSASISGSVTARIAVADLSIATNTITPLESESVAGEAGSFMIPVKNAGFLDAIGIEITLVGTDGTEYVSKLVVLTVPAESTVNAEFTYEGFEVGPKRFEVSINPSGTPVASQPENQTFSREFANIAVGDESNFVPIVVAILGLLILFGGYKVARTGSKKRF